MFKLLRRQVLSVDNYSRLVKMLFEGITAINLGTVLCILSDAFYVALVLLQITMVSLHYWVTSSSDFNMLSLLGLSMLYKVQ